MDITLLNLRKFLPNFYCSPAWSNFDLDPRQKNTNPSTMCWFSNHTKFPHQSDLPLSLLFQPLKSPCQWWICHHQQTPLVKLDGTANSYFGALCGQIPIPHSSLWCLCTLCECEGIPATPDKVHKTYLLWYCTYGVCSLCCEGTLIIFTHLPIDAAQLNWHFGGA